MDANEPLSGHVVVFGFRGVARRIVKQLARTGRRILVVDPEATSAELDRMRRYGVEYVPGLGQSRGLLATMHVEGALAVLCVTDDDLRNIEIAMLVREISADVRIVVQMANAAVGRALQPAIAPGDVLEVAELASTSFVEAAVNRTTHDLDVEGQRFIVATFEATTPGTIRARWGELAPIAVRRPVQDVTEYFPSRNVRVESGDQVTLLGTAEDFAAVDATPAKEAALRPGRTLRRRLREAFGAMSDAVDRPFRIAFAVLLGLAAVSILILTAGYQEPDGTRMNALDAIYFTSETIATVGFGDFYFRDQEPWLRIWAIVLILLGATLVTLATALLTNALVSRRLAQSLGRQRLTGMEGHIVVIGLGSIGSKVAMDLHEAGYDVAIIDGGEGQRFIPQMRAAGMQVLIGDATLAETQSDAGVQRAAGVAILTSDDLTNLETGLSVRDAVGGRPVPIVLRLFSRDLARTVGKRMNAGVPRSIAELASPWFVGAALGLNILETFYVGSAPFMAARMTIQRGDALDGVTIRDIEVPSRVIAIRPAGTFALQHPPHGSQTLHEGDTVYLIGQYEDLIDLLQRP